LGKPQSPKQEIAIAVAGPFVNIVLALALGAGVWFSGAAANLSAANLGKLAPSWQTFLVMLTAGNASLALFNLLPFFPLDGGRVLRALLSPEARRAASYTLGRRPRPARGRGHGWLRAAIRPNRTGADWLLGLDGGLS
jgi:Zn-dependent protease